MGIEDRDWYREVLRRRDGMPQADSRRLDLQRRAASHRRSDADGLPGWVVVVIGLVVVCGALMVLFRMYLR